MKWIKLQKDSEPQLYQFVLLKRDKKGSNVAIGNLVKIIDHSIESMRYVFSRPEWNGNANDFTHWSPLPDEMVAPPFLTMLAVKDSKSVGYTGYFEQFPGIITEGDTLAEVRENLAKMMHDILINTSIYIREIG